MTNARRNKTRFKNVYWSLYRKEHFNIKRTLSIALHVEKVKVISAYFSPTIANSFMHSLIHLRIYNWLFLVSIGAVQLPKVSFYLRLSCFRLYYKTDHPPKRVSNTIYKIHFKWYVTLYNNLDLGRKKSTIQPNPSFRVILIIKSRKIKLKKNMLSLIVLSTLQHSINLILNKIGSKFSVM